MLKGLKNTNRQVKFQTESRSEAQRAAQSPAGGGCVLATCCSELGAHVAAAGGQLGPGLSPSRALLFV